MLFRYFSTLLFFLPYVLPAQSSDGGHVILISFDGFRYDYVEKFDAPNFKKFVADGAAAEGLIPATPSKTFPNHYSIVTGLYPGSHGLVDNTFYDKELGLKYQTSNRTQVENPVFYGGIPLWQLAQQQGLKTASYFWVGSEAPILGQHPSYFFKYDGRVPNRIRIDQAIQWLQLPDTTRPRFITLYFSITDDAGHSFGPNAPELGSAVMEADALLGRLMQGLDTLPVYADVLLVSDHGMLEMETRAETYEILEFLPGYRDSTFTWISNGTHVHIYGSSAEALRKLEITLQENKGNFQVFEGSKTPERWHYRHHRIGDLFLLANPGHYFTTKAMYDKRLKEKAGPQKWGTHGFDPITCPEMQGIFYAKGPNIKAGVKLPAFENVHIYPFIAKLLGIQAPRVDGNTEVLAKILRD
ncbi:MAG: ectonucleotide pyrophosphatase/phosphodiesterase [Saprospiraceae bacterium]|nr:alkaline phosphatase family protein [Lewinellaceae bacterium]